MNEEESWPCSEQEGSPCSAWCRLCSRPREHTESQQRRHRARCVEQRRETLLTFHREDALHGFGRYSHEQVVAFRRGFEAAEVREPEDERTLALGHADLEQHPFRKCLAREAESDAGVRPRISAAYGEKRAAAGLEHFEPALFRSPGWNDECLGVQSRCVISAMPQRDKLHGPAAPDEFT